MIKIKGRLYFVLETTTYITKELLTLVKVTETMISSNIKILNIGNHGIMGG